MNNCKESLFFGITELFFSENSLRKYSFITCRNIMHRQLFPTSAEYFQSFKLFHQSTNLCFHVVKHSFEVSYFDKSSRCCQWRSRSLSPRHRGGQQVSRDASHDTNCPTGHTVLTHDDNEDQYLCRKVN